MLQWIAITALSIVSLSYGFFANHSGYWDRPHNFSIFFDPVQSVYRFGEFSWWYPKALYGYPYYYLLLLVSDAGSPLGVLFLSLVWILGRLGIPLPDIHTLQLFYDAVLVPTLFLLGIYWLTQVVIRKKTTQIFIFILCAWAPCMVFNFSDTGFANLMYGVFLLASILSFFERPSQTRYYISCTAAFAFSLSLNFYSLYGSCIGFALCALSIWIWRRPEDKLSQNLALKSIPRRKRWLFPAVLILGLLPQWSVYQSEKDLIRASIGESQYSLNSLLHGNPLEFFTVSIPKMGYGWADQAGSNTWALFPLGPGCAYNYMGMTTIALALLGFWYSRRKIRFPLLMIFLSCAFILVLSSHSPIFFPLMAWIAPIRTVNHFSDSLFRIWGFLPIVFLAAMGFEELFVRRKRAIIFLILFNLSVAAGIAMIWQMNETLHAHLQKKFGFTIALWLMVQVVLIFFIANKRRENGWIKNIFLFLVLIDVSAFAHEFVRDMMWGGPVLNIKAQSDGVATEEPRLRIYTDSLFGSRSLNQYIAKNGSPERLREMAWVNGFPQGPALLLGASPSGVDVLERSYNHLKVKTHAPQPGYFFLRWRWSPYFSAQVNGKNVPIEKTEEIFQSVPVPAGESVIEIKYSPTFIKWIYGFIYCTFFSFVFASLRPTLRRLRISKNSSANA